MFFPSAQRCIVSLAWVSVAGVNSVATRGCPVWTFLHAQKQKCLGVLAYFGGDDYASIHHCAPYFKLGSQVGNFNICELSAVFEHVQSLTLGKDLSFIHSCLTNCKYLIHIYKCGDSSHVWTCIWGLFVYSSVGRKVWVSEFLCFVWDDPLCTASTCYMLLEKRKWEKQAMVIAACT